MKCLALCLPLVLTTVPMLAQDPAAAPAADPAAMIGAKAVIAAALRPAPPPAAETNAYDRFLLAVRALDERQVETRGVVAPADWLAAVDLALAVEQGQARTIPVEDGPQEGNVLSASVRFRLSALLAVLPGPSDWDEIRAGLRERAERLAAAPAENAPAEEDGTKSEAKRILLAALRTAADFLGEGGRGAPAVLDELAAAPLPKDLASNRVEKAVAALRRTMDNPGVRVRAPFSPERLLRQINNARQERGIVSLSKELAGLPDDDFAPIAARLFAPVDKEAGEDDDMASHFRLSDAPDDVLARLAAAGAALPDAADGPITWELLKRADEIPEARALFDAIGAARNPLETIRRRAAEARANRTESDDRDGEEDDEEDEDGDGLSLSWNDRHSVAAQYAGVLCNLISSDLDNGRLADAEALAAPIATNDWPAVLRFAVCSRVGRGFRVRCPNDAWRSFLEARLPEGEALLKSPFLSLYAEVCRPDRAERFESTCARLLGDAAAGDKAKKALKDIRLDFARDAGDLDALEADFLEITDPTSKDVAAYASPGSEWCSGLEALGETNRLARALDRVLALAAAPAPDGGRRIVPVWAIPILARAGRFGDAESIARAAMAEAVERKEFNYYYDDFNPAEALLRVYVDAGRPADALDLAAGWPKWYRAKLLARHIRVAGRDSLVATIARALMLAGGEANAAAASIARTALELTGVYDWPFEILIETMPAEEFRALMDGFCRLNPYEERPWQWKAESLRRGGDLAAAETAARRALEIDPTDGESPKGDRIRSYSVLASILEEKGGDDALSEAATLRRVVAAVRAAEKGDELTDLGWLAGAIRRYDEAASLFSDAYCVQWRLAERLRKAGRVDEALAHYEETFRHMPAQFGQVASLCFGCEGVFSSAESAGAAGRILPALAAEPGAGASVHHLLGMLRKHQNRYDEAFAAFSRALEIDPGHFDSLRELLALRDDVERPAADWARLQAQARRLDPFRHNHDESAAEIVDWPGLWRAWDEAAAGVPAPWKEPKEPLFRFEAAARIDDAVAEARRTAENAIVLEAGAEESESDDGESENLAPYSLGDATILPARMLVTNARSHGRFWASRLVDLASALAADAPENEGGSGVHYRYLPTYSDGSATLSGAADYDIDAYFWDFD